MVATCASPPTSTPPATPEVIRVVPPSHAFSPAFEVARSTLGASVEAIEGTVSLRVAEGGPTTVYGAAGGPFLVTYRENGARFVEPVADAAWVGHPIAPARRSRGPSGSPGPGARATPTTRSSRRSSRGPTCACRQGTGPSPRRRSSAKAWCATASRTTSRRRSSFTSPSDGPQVYEAGDAELHGRGAVPGHDADGPCGRAPRRRSVRSSRWRWDSRGSEPGLDLEGG